MRDENTAGIEVAAILQAVGDIGFQAFGERTAVFLRHAHFAVPHLDAGPQLQQIGAQQGHGGAAAALFHVIELFQNEAGVHTCGQRFKPADDLLRREAL